MHKGTDNIFTKPLNIIFFAILCTALWGSAYPCVKIGYELFKIENKDIPTKLLFAGYRFFLAGILVLLFSIIVNKKLVPLKKRRIPGIILLGVVQTTIQYIFFYIGLSNTTGVKAAILNGTGTFIVVILAHFWYRNDKLNLQKIIGCIIGFSGVILINLDGVDMGGGFYILGEGFIILAAVSFAFGFIITKSVTQQTSSMIATGYQLSIGGLLLILLGFLNGGRLSYEGLESIFMLVYLALLSAIAFTVWAQLLKYNPVGKVSVYNFMVPILGSLFSALFLGEAIFTIKGLTAVLFVSTGIYLVNAKNVKILKKL
jgi:drug/metabolite transporter (DMT)-like permease